MKHNLLLGLFILTFIHLNSHAQTLGVTNSILGSNDEYELIKFHNTNSSELHYQTRPFLIDHIADSSNGLAIIDNPSIRLSVNANYIFEAGKENSKSGYPFESSAAPSVNLKLKKKLNLFFGGQVTAINTPSFLDQNAIMPDIIPGYNIKYNTNDTLPSTYDFFGYLSYSPNKYINLQAGKHKHFWGDGYRSLFLSDFAPTFPYVKLTGKVWKLKYDFLCANFKDALEHNGFKSSLKEKYAVMHLLSYNVTKNINIAFFEGISWQGADTNRARGYELNYLNPAIFFRPVEYSLGSSDNAFLGFAYKVKLLKKQILYGQLLLDEFLLNEVKSGNGWWANKQGVQLGIRSYDLFKVKNLDALLEYNYVRPYTYSHGSPQQSYGHLNHPLAHPLGANFKEGIIRLRYKYEKLTFLLHTSYAVYGADSAGFSMGQNIFETYANRPREYGNYTTQGIRNELTTLNLTVSYAWLKKHPEHQFYLRALARSHSVANSTNVTSIWITAGLSSPLWKRYFDY